MSPRIAIAFFTVEESSLFSASIRGSTDALPIRRIVIHSPFSINVPIAPHLNETAMFFLLQPTFPI
jgi:hypothetical protein